ncbi:decaprenyl-phosphate phosphoribosyltransferase [Synechococcus sp. MIT S9503]|uniref:decaprenyl-phosphate phosphoribosyltransferase n=1 Tax=Synechococcus sp. MIT S9503 TaxID=3082547 RepID=UPI0039A74C1F
MEVQLLLKASRVSQWTKNLLVFAAAIFSKHQSLSLWWHCLVAFLGFCFVSSAIYLINDVVDREADRAHPRKRFRPIASGQVSLQLALTLSFLWIALGLFLAYSLNLVVVSVFIVYIVIQIFYCFYLKRKPLLDLFCIASGFLLRAIAGLAAAAPESWSPWFLLTVGLLALFLAVEKRKAELRTVIDRGVVTRKVLLRYSLPLLLRLESIVASSSFMAYALWSAGPALRGAETSWMLLSTPFVLVGIFRYQLLSDPEENERRVSKSYGIASEKPEEILINDPGIQLTLTGWLVTVVCVNYLNGSGVLP